LHPYPEDLVIATKGGLVRTAPGQWPRDLRPERIKQCCEEEAASTLDEVAAAHDASRFRVALAWLLAHSPVTLPIPGTSKVAHLDANVAAAGIQLSDDELAKLDAI
jgi:aryl-alcohol dehydrogenase-like predicted oxidoreductase